MPSTAEDDSWSDVRDESLGRYLRLLADGDSPLLAAGEGVRAQLEDQFLNVVDEAAGELRLSGPEQQALSSAIGWQRAAIGIHPSESLAAAHLIFCAALPGLAEHLHDAGVTRPTQQAALRLNKAILREMALAAKAYVDYLLEQLTTAHAEEARRLSRELHDEVGPAVALGLQSLDLIEHYIATDPKRAVEKTQAGRQALLDALGLVRSLSAQTRLGVSPTELPTALSEQLGALPESIRTGLDCEADLRRVPTSYAREIFLVLREAVRNAARHGDPGEVTIDLQILGTTFVGTVTDDGRGFDLGSRQAAGTGISSMRERAALFGGTLELRSEPGRTQVVLSVPLPREDQT